MILNTYYSSDAVSIQKFIPEADTQFSEFNCTPVWMEWHYM